MEMKIVTTECFSTRESIAAATLHAGLVQLIDTQDKGGKESVSGRIGTTHDRLVGGCLFLAVATARVLDALADWEAWDAVGRGVFVYEKLESDSRGNLAAYLLDEIDGEDWYDIAENNQVPTDHELSLLLTTWMVVNDVPLALDPKEQAYFDMVVQRYGEQTEKNVTLAVNHVIDQLQVLGAYDAAMMERVHRAVWQYVASNKPFPTR